MSTRESWRDQARGNPLTIAREPAPAPEQPDVRDWFQEQARQRDRTTGRIRSRDGLFLLDPDAQQLTMGAALGPTTGVGLALGLWDGVYTFRIGDPAGSHLVYTIAGGLAVVGGLTATSGAIGGWTISASALTSGSVVLDATNQQLRIGATAYLAGVGVFAGFVSGVPRFRVGDPAGHYLAYDGVSTITLNGQIVAGVNIQDGAIGSVQLGSSSVTSVKIGDNQVTTAKIGSAQVTSTQLADGSVIEAKIGANSVTVTKIGDGVITQVKMASGLRVPVVLASLPALPSASYPEGALAFLTTDDKLYRSTGTTWTAAVAAVDLSGTINLASQVSGQLTTAFAAAGLINANVTINPDGTLSGAGAGQVALGSLPGTVNLGTQVSGALTAAFAAAGLINANVTINADGTLSGAGSGQANLGSMSGQIDAARLADAAVIAAKLANYAVGSRALDGAARSQHGVFMETFETDPQWTLTSGAGTGEIVAGVGVAGGNVYQATGQRWMVYPQNIPYDPSKLYRMRVRVRRTTTVDTANDRFYAGFEGVGANGTTRVNAAGADTASSQHYFVASSVDAGGWTLNEWQEFTAWASGTSAPADLSPATVTDPATLHSDVRYIRPLLILNYQNGTGNVMQVDYVVIDVFDEDGLVRSYLGLNVDGVVAADRVVASSILAGAVTAVKINALAVTTAKLDALAVTTAKLAVGAVTADQIAANAVTAVKINALAVTAAKIDSLAVTTDKLAANAVTAAKIAANTITAAQIAADTITAAQIAAGAIGASEIAAGAIVAGKIAAGVIVAADIASGTITALQIAASTITSSQITGSTLSAIRADMGTITAGAIVIGSTNRIWLNDAGDGAIAVGGSTKASAPFRVTAAGGLTATNATITGTIVAGSVVAASSFTAASPLFTGSITMRAGGSFAKWWVEADGSGSIMQMLTGPGWPSGLYSSHWTRVVDHGVTNFYVDRNDATVGSPQFSGDIQYMRVTAAYAGTASIEFLQPLGNITVGTVTSTGSVLADGSVVADLALAGQWAELNRNSALEILSLRSTGSVSHGMTGITTAATYGWFKKYATSGILQVGGMGGGNEALRLVGYVNTVSTSKTTAGNAIVTVDAWARSGTGAVAPSANANVFGVKSGNTMRFIVDNEGDFFYDGTGSAYDRYDDAKLVRALSRATGRDSVILGELDDGVEYTEADLVEAGVLTATRADGGMVNGAALQRLHNGAVWQQEGRVQNLIQALVALLESNPGLQGRTAALQAVARAQRSPVADTRPTP